MFSSLSPSDPPAPTVASSDPLLVSYVLSFSCRIGNIQTAFALLEQVWSSNEAGEKWVNWALMSKQRGWNVSFA